MITTDKLCWALYNTKYHYHNEKDLQQGVGQVLSGLNLNFKPEYSLAPRDRIDFLITDGSGVGIECKSNDSKGGTSLSAVTRQLMRYAQSPLITGLILLTTMSKHKNLPDTMNGKPIYVVHLLLSLL